MAWIEMIPEERAEGELKVWYDKLTEPWGGVDNIMKIHSLNLASLKAHFEIYKCSCTASRELSRVQREMIAVVASAANHCKLLTAPSRSGSPSADERRCAGGATRGRLAPPRSTRPTARCSPTSRSSRSGRGTWRPPTSRRSAAPASPTRAILDINQVTGYYAYVNRLADGLGVELEAFWVALDAQADTTNRDESQSA